MKNSQTLTLSKKKYTFHILDSINVEIEVTENPYQLPIDDLFTMAARINKKRTFLFVSKVLGKHLPIDANKGLTTAALLAVRFLESIKGLECREKERLLLSFQQGGEFIDQPFIPPHINPIVIGFAETATALGHAFFSCFQNADYFHTTREEIENQTPGITFEEEHSHATSHRCYVAPELLQNNREIILVDDEMTTGKTAINIIRSIHEQFPRKEYTVVSILDWRSDENKAEFFRLEKELDIKIKVVSLLSGTVLVHQLKGLEEQSHEFNRENQIEMSIEKVRLAQYFKPSPFHDRINVPYINDTGRFGLNNAQQLRNQQKMAKAAKFLKDKRSGQNTLCLGTGEFMYLPMKLAAGMGKGISYQSTTRSPIYIKNQEGYGARFGLTFPNPEDWDVTHFVYNIPPGFYDELFIFFEREIELKNLQPFLDGLAPLQIESVKVVFFSNARGE
ncbi:phosphoribosyltransferase family protein [Paenibacillus sp. BSR1-1]|uniref:phosphoribosyltransferase family protein n=1 Tax=Paenibacillus sp. BSR1-1 TaxID=3020845 RepID=UPI0025B016E0|nr:phosphoribosyltransferase family protein [Paenibacillus sp. BSR1-1]MDN3016796.1 phosphoribosyltransferase family protein [Paenibacillus sp. BSR1-1]